ncbi:unnamed protein product [Vitrella brassicaformis CCMP3155]|uniref:Large ribosomal subunit protein uL4 C-terminal domain-containing protein n=1 Tax=Vitrella brassicaformis (strain CCMP3155) TaxID=1169540 RepID=A0A0G4EQE0_VITBC|nr:unnamed protein product [Vitrella brassicaformis CCMP3155]|eukprot:CEL99649.1 unnamed protein product [Vitrella brassicaformis CCMP3155]
MRPTVTVYDLSGESLDKTVKTPAVFGSPIRPDLVREVHRDVNKNKRQAYGVVLDAGYGSSAESWGTGRAVARIPRVPGGGTHRSGQGAFGNMCRGGGMFNPNPTWRRWHRKVNVTKKRHAVASAVAATGVPPLVMARGHRIGDIPELPLVIADKVQDVAKTKTAMEFLSKVGATNELDKVKESKKVRAGRGKLRNRRYVLRRGPLVVYEKDNGIVRAFRNIPGVELCSIDRLNLLQLAPGGTIGRFVIWTESAFSKLTPLFGTYRSGSVLKKGYHLPRPALGNADLARLINSSEIQSVVKPMRMAPKRTGMRKNPLKNLSVLARLNPAALEKKALARLQQTEGTPEREALLSQKRAREEAAKEFDAVDEKYRQEMMDAFNTYAEGLPLKKQKAGPGEAAEEADEEGDQEEEDEE